MQSYNKEYLRLQQSYTHKDTMDTRYTILTNNLLVCAGIKDIQVDAFKITTSLACSHRVSPQRDALLYWTAFNDNQNHSRPNKIVPPRGCTTS